MIKDVIEKNNYSLLGQIEMSDEDYDALLDYTRNRAKYLYVQTIVKADLLLSVCMVQIAIRRYREGKYWSCFMEELGIDISSAKLNYLGQIFSKTLKIYNLFELKRNAENSSQIYVENIKAHAFITNYYMSGFFDFAYAFFQNNLFRDLPDDIEDDFEELAEFMSTTLNSNKDSFSTEESSRKAAKSYRLLKSTRAAIAQCDVNTIQNIFYPVLSLIDKYYYEEEIPQVIQNRFEYGFVEWCKKRTDSSTEISKNDQDTRRLYSHKPYMKVDINNENVFLVIPQQKFRNNDCEGEAVVNIVINGYTEERQLELYRSFGIYISEEIRIPVPSVFDAIDIIIKTKSEKEYQIKKSNYRIFNNTYQSIEKFNKGHNYLLVRPEIDVTWLDENDLIDYDNTYRLWKYYSADIDEDSVCYVGNKPLSIIGEFSVEPVYDCLVENFFVYDCDNSKMIVTRLHPTISFVVDKPRVNGTVVIINQTKYKINEIKGKNCYEWPEDKSKMAINILLDNFLEKDNGTYKVILDVPGEHKRLLCEYLLLKQFNCKFNKPRYTYDEEAVLTVTKDGISVYDTNEKWKCDYDDKELVIYKIPLSEKLSEIEFSLVVDKNYTVKMPVRMFMYGFSQMNMRCDKPHYLWYSDLKETVYVRIPGAKTASAYWGKETHNKSYGVEIAPAMFRIDISEFVRRISEETRKKWQYINIEYEDNAVRRIALPAILRNVLIEPYFELKYLDEIVCMEAEVKGDAELYVDIADIRTKEKIVLRRKIESGKIYFPELETNTAYDIYPIMEEEDDFGFDINITLMKPIGNCVCIDSSNLVGCQLPIKKIFYDEEIMDVSFDYFVNVSEKVDDFIYEGYMFGYKLSQDFSKGRYILDSDGKRKKIKLGKVRFEVLSADGGLELMILFYSYADEEWMFPYYDSDLHSKYLVKPDSPILQNTGQEYIERLIELSDDMTVFEVNVQKLRRF